MKLKFGFTLVTCFLSLSAEATNFKTVKTPFWQAPQITQLAFKLAPVESELTTECARFNRLMFTSEGKPFPQTVDRFLRYRSTPLISAPMGVRDFQSHFTVLEPEKLTSEVESFFRDHSNALPYYYQEKAITDVHLSSGAEVSVRVLNDERSIVGIGQQIGAPESEIQILTSYDGPVLKIMGKDVACDLILGNISLEVTAPATVHLLDEQRNKIEEFYRVRVSKSLNRAMNKKTSSPMRLGARLGGYLGEDLLNEFGHRFEDRIEALEDLVELFFIPGSVKPSSNLADFGGKYLVNLPLSASAADVSVSLSVKP